MKELFNKQFKFQINDSVRHKGDTHKFDSDMGLLVLERHLIESLDGDGGLVYERCYVCRMIRFSGSGDLARFSERELMGLKEYEVERAERRRETDEMKQEMKMVEREIQELFGVSKEDYLFEVVNGVPDTSMKFRWSGFSTSEDGVKLLVTESLFTAANRKDATDKIKRQNREWTSKDQFVISQ